jgi:hypothetical protein
MTTMEIERRQTVCPGCDAGYPAACGFCPTCGTPLLQIGMERSFSVIAPAILSAQLRADVAARIAKVLDCPGDVSALDRALADGEVRLVDNLDQEPARALAAMLARMHVGARVEPTGTAPRLSAWAWIPGYLPILAGLVVGVVTRVPLSVGFVGGVVLSVVTLAMHGRKRAQSALAAYAMPVIPGSLPGWDAAAKPLAPLLRSLPAPAREPLAALATHTAFILDGVADYGGPAAEAATKLLESGIAAARAGSGPAVVEELRRLAVAAGQARSELGQLSDAAALEGHQQIAQKLEQAALAALPARS